MIPELIQKHYNLTITAYEKVSVGAGSNTYHITDTNGNEYILKNANVNQANHPQDEPPLCAYLLSKGVPVSEFIQNVHGDYIWYDSDAAYHLQKFVQGTNFKMHTAPSWLMREMPKMLGKIHTQLLNYTDLPVGIGENFFKYMTPQTAMNSYKKSYQYAAENGFKRLTEDLLYRTALMSRFSTPEIDLSKLTKRNTHGDFFISQLICSKTSIVAVVDWTTACIHPVVWEIIRSFIYGSPACKDGNIIISDLVEYTKIYLDYASLNEYDLKMMPYVFYYQISVCDYYNQYFSSDADNRAIYLDQAVLSTKLMKWFEKHAEDLSAELLNLV